MKHNGTQGTYHSVPQNLQNDEIEESKKVPSQESVVENGQNVKTSPTPSNKEEDGTEDEKKPMSPLRKFCFVLSLLQCVLFVVAFGWLIPCKIPRHSDRNHYSHNWELNFYGEDFITNLAITGNEQNPVALIFGYSSLSNGSHFGIRAINAFDGSSMWQTDMVSKPVDIICDSLDVDSNKIPDCIITDDTGKLFAISAENGQTIWYIHKHDVTIDPQSISKPIVGHSCHGDNIPYIYAAIQDKQGLFNFVTISGLTGQIEDMKELPECSLMPENMMWRNGKIDSHDMDPPQELIMSCANKVGNRIVYNINTDEFCKNVTTQPFNEMFFKVAIVDGNKGTFHMKLINTNEGDNVITLNGEKLQVHSEDKEEQALFEAESGVSFQDFVVGHFTNNSLANVLILSRSDTAKSDSITLLDNTNSRVLWNTLVENGTAKGLFLFKNGLNTLDTVLLKTVSETTEIHPDLANVTSQLTDLTYFEEKYILLECFETGSFKTVAHDLTMATCHPDTHCKPDVLGEKETALLADVDNDGKEELIYFTRKTLPSTFLQSVTLKLVRLSEPGNPNSCSSCHCSN